MRNEGYRRELGAGQSDEQVRDALRDLTYGLDSVTGKMAGVLVELRATVAQGGSPLPGRTREESLVLIDGVIDERAAKIDYMVDKRLNAVAFRTTALLWMASFALVCLAVFVVPRVFAL